MLNRDDRRPFTVQFRDRSYNASDLRRVIAGGESALVEFDTRRAFQWYDLHVTISGSASFERRFEGRVETGKWTFTDPAIGRANA
jgi:phospholipase C